MSASLVVSELAGAMILLSTPSISIYLLAVVPLGMEAKAAFPRLSSLLAKWGSGGVSAKPIVHISTGLSG
jgi:hypothetical protein